MNLYPNRVFGAKKYRKYAKRKENLKDPSPNL